MRQLERRTLRLGWFVTVSAALLLSCGGGEAPAPETEMEMEAETTGAARVFFVRPEEGGTYPADAPVVFEFGVENYQISPVPEKVEQVREGIGHHHLGVDTQCLPVGDVIPRADPWIHFGDGSNTIEMLLEPGSHTFALQLADDEHRTLPVPCETLTIQVEQRP